LFFLPTTMVSYQCLSSLLPHDITNSSIPDSKLWRLASHMATTSTAVMTTTATVKTTTSTVTKATTTAGSAALTPSVSTPPNCAHQTLTGQHPTGHQHRRSQTEWRLLILMTTDIRQYCPFTYPLHGTSALPSPVIVD